MNVSHMSTEVVTQSSALEIVSIKMHGQSVSNGHDLECGQNVASVEEWLRSSKGQRDS